MLSSKLALFRKVKMEDSMSTYVMDRNIPFRSRLAKLRLSDHKLEIEIGRFNNILLSRRNCRLCQKGIEDVPHFLLVCERTKEERILFYSEIGKIVPHFEKFTSEDKIKQILNPSVSTRMVIAMFISECFKSREKILE